MARRAHVIKFISTTSNSDGSSNELPSSFSSSGPEDNHNVPRHQTNELDLISLSVKVNNKRSFLVQMRQSYIEGDCRLLVPFIHGDRNLKGMKDAEVVLFVGNHKCEVVVKFSNDQYKFGRGPEEWHTLVSDV